MSGLGSYRCDDCGKIGTVMIARDYSVLCEECFKKHTVGIGWRVAELFWRVVRTILGG